MAPAPGFYEVTQDGVRVRVRVSPGAKSNTITGLWSGAEGEARLAVKVTAAPEKGKANAAVIGLLSRALGVPKSALTVASGDTSRLKTIHINGDGAAIAAALNALIGDGQ